jgi:hypothetical protein
LATQLETIIVAPTPSVDQWALPFTEGIFYCPPAEVLKLAEQVAAGIRKLRVKFAGREYPEAAIEFSADYEVTKKFYGTFSFPKRLR